LHPNHFEADKNCVAKYFNPDSTYFILRFSKLNAHHDTGINGISDKLAFQIISQLSSYGNVYITSERELAPKLELFRMNIDPRDIHHVLSYASLFIGDSQTMSAESAVLGTPYIRFNDFVGRIGYLNELENKYRLGFGVKTNDPDRIFEIIRDLVAQNFNVSDFCSRKQLLLEDKIDFSKLLTWFLDEYPYSFVKWKNGEIDFASFK
jgi:uncharacterized protein